MHVTVCGEGGDLLTLTILGRSHPGAADYWDGNWLAAAVQVRAGGFSGSVGGDLRADELAALFPQLRQVQESLKGTADFETMERWLSVRFSGDGRGHLVCRCVVRGQSDGGNVLEARIATDQTFLRRTVEELAAVVEAFPVIGSP
jgi:hypothetical protein